ncbi:MAG: DPP IV N-terminal domain-containing protein, partial [Bacteroidaceae bacterium]|nr:DPP IV N-terminal domain-containing protein [Bacteroidaceae bacterium]
MKIKHILMAMTLMVAGNAAAQKLLTLEDVMWSGSNYYNLMPENKYTAWWGNQAVETTADEVRDLKTGKTIVTVEQVNKCFPEKIAFSGHNFSFPLPKEPVVMLTKGQRRAMLNFRTGQVLLDVTLPKDAVARDFNVKSKQTAYTIGGNLYILTPKGESLTVSSDGSTDDSENIVYGTSVHRDEFGISKGTFWSPDGTKLAFYRMDQSMVPSYPQVDITKRIAETYADHYPMAGETSHQVTVG